MVIINSFFTFTIISYYSYFATNLAKKSHDRSFYLNFFRFYG